MLVDSSVVELSSRLSPSMRAYGAMVDVDVENVTMCVRGSEVRLLAPFVLFGDCLRTS